MASLSPVYLLAGGPGHRRKGPDPLLQQVFGQTGRPSPSVAYVGAASNDDKGFFEWIAASFREAGSGPVRLAPTASRHSDLDEARSVLASSDLIFLSGGDVEAGMQVLAARGIVPVLQALHEGGRGFFGLSAGSIMLARCWVRWSDPDDDDTAEPFDCLGFAPVLCDTHAEREDWAELHVLLGLAAGSAAGYGIPTGGALCVYPDGRTIALGQPVARFKHTHGKITALPPLQPGK